MTLKACRKCGEMVSTGAMTCPKCGIGRPTRPPRPKPSPIWGVFASLVIFFAVGSYLVAFWTASTPESARAPTPLLDHKRPWFVLAGAPLCASKEDLAAFISIAADEQATPSKSASARFVGPRATANRWLKWITTERSSRTIWYGLATAG